MYQLPVVTCNLYKHIILCKIWTKMNWAQNFEFPHLNQKIQEINRRKILKGKYVKGEFGFAESNIKHVMSYITSREVADKKIRTPLNKIPQWTKGQITSRNWSLAETKDEEVRREERSLDHGFCKQMMKTHHFLVLFPRNEIQTWYMMR